MSRCNYCGSESVYSNALKICPSCFNHLKQKLINNNTEKTDWWKIQSQLYEKPSKKKYEKPSKKKKSKAREIKLSGVLLTIQAGLQGKDPDVILVSVRSKTAIKELQKNLGCKIKISAKALPSKVVDEENWQPEEKKRRMLRIE